MDTVAAALLLCEAESPLTAEVGLHLHISRLVSMVTKKSCDDTLLQEEVELQKKKKKNLKMSSQEQYS